MRRIARAIPVLISVAASLALVAAGAVPAMGADHRERVLVEGAPLVGGSNGMYFDADNNLYVAQVWGRQISKLDPETGEILEKLGPAESVFFPDDVTVGPDGTLFWTDIGLGTVFARRPGGPSVPLYPLGAYPSANPLTLSDDGTRLFFAQCYGAGTNGVYQLDFTTWATTPILEGIPGCASNAMDYRDGALYSPRPFEGRVVRVDLATKAVTNVTTGWGVPIAVKFDSQGHLYAANQGNGELVRINLEDPNTATNREVIATLPVGWFDNLAFDKHDRLYISSASDATVLEVLPGGGFRTVSPGGMSLATGLTVLAGTVYTVSPVGALYGYDAKTGAERSTVRSVFGIGPFPPPTSVTSWGDQLVLMSVMTGALMLWDPVAQGPTLVTSFAQPVDATAFRGDLIVTEAATGNVVRASGPGLADREVIATMFGAAGLAATEDDVYVGNAATGKVLQIIADGKVLATPVIVASGLVSPEGLDLRSNGTKLLVVDGAANTLSEVNLVSGKVKALATDLAFFSGLPPGLPLGLFNNVEVYKGSIYVNADAANVIIKIPAKGNAK